ncbi:Cache 3/Cache 2 fusion domain-containing protein [Anaerosolibacter sp.]|uniref:Cache 3/Cache 2 fusion domain-containing protein n=1 Tax=Anaerosolibacter sp. TaxID=1872527 RepID=UPI0039EE36E3
MKSRIKSRLFIWFIVVSVIPLVFIGGFSYYLIFNKISLQTEETITNINKGIYNMVDTQQEVLSRWMESAGASFSSKLSSLGDSHFDYEHIEEFAGYRLPTWYIGSQKITNDFSLVNDLIEKEKLPATIFQLHNNKFIRVSTNVRQADGKRIVGTVLDSGPVYERIINGQQYLGRANVEGIWHATVYQPIWDKNGKLIGAFVLGRREQEYEMIKAIKNIFVGESGYTFIIDSKGDAIIHPTNQGKNLSKYDWVQEILSKKNGSITYDFQDQKKIAYYTYYAPWDWYIVTGGYYSELFNTTKELQNLLFLAVFLAIGVSSFIAYFLSKAFSMPINQLVNVMRETQNGDLSVRLSYLYDDEFKIVGNAFNAMLNTISLLIGRIGYNSANLKESSKRLMIDIQQSMQSLQGIENSIASLNKQIQQETAKQSVLYNYRANEDFLQQLYQLSIQIRRALDDQPDERFSRISAQLTRLEALVVNGYPFGVDIQASGSDNFSFPMPDTNKINSLEVEVEKLKLLVSHIDSSASSLDDIALSLDQYIKKFKIDSSDS